MICPECNHKMACNQTKHYSHPDRGFNYVERRRICGECGTKIFTIEIPADEYRVEETYSSDEQDSDGAGD